MGEDPKTSFSEPGEPLLFTKLGADPRTVGEDPKTSFSEPGEPLLFLSWVRTREPWEGARKPCATVAHDFSRSSSSTTYAHVHWHGSTLVLR